jgi:Outer membrane protein beta-barrel domain
VRGALRFYGRLHGSKTTVKKLSLIFLLSLVVYGTAQAQPFEVGIFGGFPRLDHTPFGSPSAVAPVDTDTRLHADYSTGVWIGLDTKGYYGHELSYMRTPIDLKTVLRTTDSNGNTVTTNPTDRITLHMAMYNFLLYFMPRGEKWRPYVTGGAQGYDYPSPHIDTWPSGKNKHYGLNFGGGIKLSPFPHAIVRFDLRDYIGGKPWDLTFSGNKGKVNQVEATVGVGVAF